MANKNPNLGNLKPFKKGGEQPSGESKSKGWERKRDAKKELVTSQKIIQYLLDEPVLDEDGKTQLSKVTGEPITAIEKLMRQLVDLALQETGALKLKYIATILEIEGGGYQNAGNDLNKLPHAPLQAVFATTADDKALFKEDDNEGDDGD